MESKEKPGALAGGPGQGQNNDSMDSIKLPFDRQAILDAIQGRSGEVRIECPHCEGGQKKTLSINSENGLYQCHRCGFKGRARETSEKKPLANYIWDRAWPIDSHPYLEAKKVKSYGLRRDLRGTLLIPFSAYGQLSTLQTISATNKKKFLPKKHGCHAKGSYFKIEGNPDTVYIVEGYATGASVHEATGATVVVVGMKSNFVNSIEPLKEKLNGSKIILCSDNDSDKDGGGLTACIRAAKKFNAKVVMPEKAGQDFNDLFCEHGPEAVREQLNKFIDVEQTFKTEAKLHFTADAADTMQEAGIDSKEVINAAYEGQKGTANLFIKTFQGIFCNDRAAGLWYEFTDHYWELDKIGKAIRDCDVIQGIFKRVLAEINSKILEIATKIKNANEEEKRNLQAKVDKLDADYKAVSSSVHYLNTLIYRKQSIDFAAHGAESLGITGEEWDQKPWQLAVQNGIIDLKTGELKPGKPEDYIKSACPTIYDQEAVCPAFEKFMLDIFDNDMETVDFIRLLLGAGLIGHGAFKQYIVIFSGQGRNGKDTLMGIIQHVLGLDLAAPIPSELILDQGANGKRSSQGPSADLMKLRGLRLAYCNETSQGRSFNSGVAKQLSGGGLMTARPPHGKRNIDWEQTHLLIMMTNSKPRAPIDDYAFWKRVKAIHFPLSFILEPKEKNERQADVHLAEKLKKEAPGILNFLLSGCLDYQKIGLIEPAAVKKANLQYLKDVDLTGIFIDECCILNDNATVTAKELYAAYKEWAKDNGNRPVAGQAFGRYIKKRFDSGRKTSGMFYIGIKLLSEDVGNEG